MRRGVRGAVARAEGALCPLLDRSDELVRELLGRDVRRPVAAIGESVPDGVQQVRLAEAGRAVEEERVVEVAGIPRDALGGGDRETVPRSRDELLEGVALAQARRGRERLHARLGRRRRCGAGRSERLRRWLLLARERLKADVERLLGQVGDRSQQQGAKALPQPLRDELGTGSDDEPRVLEAQPLGALEPRLRSSPSRDAARARRGSRARGRRRRRTRFFPSPAVKAHTTP